MTLKDRAKEAQDQAKVLAEAVSTGKDPDLIRLEQLAADLHAKGIDFAIEHGRVLTAAVDRDREVNLDIDGNRIRLGIVSDTHGGSKYEQLTALRHFYGYADERKVHAFIHAGDITQGPDRMHRGMELEVHAHGAEAQVGYVVATYPKSNRKNVKTYLISGNHDDSFLKDNGANVVRMITAARPDIVYAGQDAAYVTFNGLRMYVVHPDGGGAYAKTYKLQKLAATLPIERNVRLILCGHYHNFGMTLERDTLAIMLPCFQAQYPWLARKALHPDIGGLILEITMDNAGNPIRIQHELVRYQPIDDDWDHEISASVSRGWRPDGPEV